MADYFSYLSILNPGFATVTGATSARAGTFAYVSFLNPPSATFTGTVQQSYFSDGNGVSFGTSGTVVTAAVMTARSQLWADLGVYFGSGSPGPGVQYAEWVAGAPGYFMWIRVP